MTNPNMVKPPTSPERAPAAAAPEPNARPLPPMPAPEDSATPTTGEEPLDSPQPNPSAKRAPPPPGTFGLTTRRED